MPSKPVVVENKLLNICKIMFGLHRDIRLFSEKNKIKTRDEMIIIMMIWN